MMGHGSLTFVRWCVTLSVFVSLFFALPTHGLARTTQEPQKVLTELMLDPSSGPPGTTINTRGSGFYECGESIELLWDGDHLGTAQVRRDGSFSVMLTVPKKAKSGSHTVTSSCGEAAAEFNVTVTPPQPAPPPSRRADDSPVLQPPVGAAPPPPALPAPSRAAPPPRAEPPPPAPGSTLAQLDEIAGRELESGSILYNPPDQMRVGEVERIEVRITRRFPDEIAKGLQGRGNPRVEELLVGAFMKVELTGDDFEIMPIGSPVKPLLAPSFTEWRWEVTPIASGTNPLSVIATVVYQDQPLKERVFERRINVVVNPMYSTETWFASNWDKLLAALGITAAGVFGALYRRLRRKVNEQRSEP